jgi:hypothetical protein
VYRVVDHPQGFDMVAFPRGSAPQIVDWVDYKQAVQSANPVKFAADLVKRAGPVHRIWLAWQPGYQTYGIRCETLAAALQDSPGWTARNLVLSSPTKYYEPMNLTEFLPTGDGPG